MLVTVVIAAVAALAAIPRTAASAAGEACPGGGRLVVNANGNYSNSADYGADGHIWALDTARESIQMWQIGTNTYCMMRHDNGTFTSFAGVSPEGTGTVRAGATGHWSGEIVAVIQGTFAPTLPTKGFVGDFDAKCDQTGTCLGPGFNAGLYFSSITDVDYLTFSATLRVDLAVCGASQRRATPATSSARRSPAKTSRGWTGVWPLLSRTPDSCRRRVTFPNTCPGDPLQPRMQAEDGTRLRAVPTFCDASIVA